MDVPFRRVVGSLGLLLGITLLALGLYSGELNDVLEIVKRILEASVAGAP